MNSLSVSRKCKGNSPEEGGELGIFSEEAFGGADVRILIKIGEEIRN